MHLVQSREPKTSESLALCLGTNPVVIRRILGRLKLSGIVSSEKGHGGGWVAVKAPFQVSLYDVYQSLDEKIIPRSPELPQGEQCVVLKTLARTIGDFEEEANTILNQRLKKITLADIEQEISQETSPNC